MIKKCPFCSSEKIDFEGINQVTKTKIYILYTCNHCNHAIREIYKLNKRKYSDLTKRKIQFKEE